MKVFDNVGILRLPPDGLITFRDRSHDFSPSSISRDIPLPNPRYLAIHAAIARILHMSNAGKFFDELLGKYKGDGSKILPVQSWAELERLMERCLLRDSVESGGGAWFRMWWIDYLRQAGKSRVLLYGSLLLPS